MGHAVFTKEHRLRRSDQFKRVIRSGQRIHTRNLILYLSSGEGERKLGITASRKTGNAVRRNRSKRVLREAFRLTRDHLPEHTELVVIVKQRTPWPTFADYSKELVHAFDAYRNRRPGH